MIRRTYYGWYDPRRGVFLLSHLPPDAPVRPSVPYSSLAEIQQMALKKRAQVLWYPPLTREQESLGSGVQSW
jgi:hypothetical protein